MNFYIRSTRICRLSFSTAKAASLDTFRIGDIGDATPSDMGRLVEAAAEMDRR